MDQTKRIDKSSSENLHKTVTPAEAYDGRASDPFSPRGSTNDSHGGILSLVKQSPVVCSFALTASREGRGATDAYQGHRKA